MRRYPEKMLDELTRSYRGTIKLWCQYWSAYGGAAAVLKSLYFLIAIILTILNFGAWTKPGWWDVILASVPTILGFTLAGLAVFMSMDSGFSRFMTGGKKTSPFMSLVSSFVHFIVIQTISFLYALTSKSLDFTLKGLPDWYYSMLPIGNKVAGFIGYLLFIYAILLTLGATFSIFRSSSWYEKYIEKLKEIEKS